MAVWLSLNLSQGTPNETARTNTVTATVTVHYSGGSYNGNSPSGTLIIDGLSFGFTCNFNYAGIGQGAASTGTGSVTAATRTVTVSYGSSTTKTVSASASFASGTGSGTVSASNSISLTPISSSSGSSGGSGGDVDNSEEYTGSTIMPKPDNTELVPGNVTIKRLYGRYQDGWEEMNANAYVGSDFHFTYGGIVRYVTVIPFTTPEFTGVPKTLRIALETGEMGNSIDELPVYIALCRSDSNRDSYVDAGDTVTDSNQIAVGSITLANLSYCFTEIPATGLESETDYYLILWSTYDDHVIKCALPVHDAHSMNVDFESEGGDSGGEDVGGDTGNEDEGGDSTTTTSRGAFYISNGTEYTEYKCFIDNGTTWDEVTFGGDSGESGVGTSFRRVESWFDTNENGGTDEPIDVGFKPDIVVFPDFAFRDGSVVLYSSAAAVFSEVPTNGVDSFTAISFYEVVDGTQIKYEGFMHCTDNGFKITSLFWTVNNVQSAYSNMTIHYVAIKYT